MISRREPCDTLATGKVEMKPYPFHKGQRSIIHRDTSFILQHVHSMVGGGNSLKTRTLPQRARVTGEGEGGTNKEIVFQDIHLPRTWRVSIPRRTTNDAETAPIHRHFVVVNVYSTSVFPARAPP